MNSVFGRYLNVDLSSGRIADYGVPADWQARFLGGKGIAARILLDELPEKVDPFGAENVLVFATGPFQGTGLTGAGRHAVLAVSPKTGAVADSYAGGYFGHELGKSGYDGILVRGVSATPVVLALIDGTATLIAAADLCLGGPFGDTPKAQRIIPGKTFQFLAMARPVIATDTPGNRELLTHKESAYIVPPANAEALAAAIASFQDDVALRESLAAGGYECYRRQCSETVIRQRLYDIVDGYAR